MMISKSQAQQTTGPLFVDEEENDVENVVIDTVLPFDRCLSVDKQCEEEENTNKKNREMLEYQYWYLAKQLEDGKFYRISDIITDNAIKEKNVYE